MTPPGGNSFMELQNERHQENIRKFQQINTDLGANTTLTRQALSESQANRHQLKGLDESLKGLVHLFELDKRERREERIEAEAERRAELQKLEDTRKDELKVTADALRQQADEIRKLQIKFTWAVGFIAALSFVFHEVGDLLSPLIRHLLQ